MSLRNHEANWRVCKNKIKTHRRSLRWRRTDLFGVGMRSPRVNEHTQAYAGRRRQTDLFGVGMRFPRRTSRWAYAGMRRHTQAYAGIRRRGDGGGIALALGCGLTKGQIGRLHRFITWINQVHYLNQLRLLLWFYSSSEARSAALSLGMRP
jgi:hypothetical protein